MKLIVGLGNPDDKYKNTFHNLGFMTADKTADILGAEFKKTKCRALIAEIKIGKEKVIIAKPLTYMNLSGESVRELVEYFKVSLTDLLVLYDDYDLPLTEIRIRERGSAGTHNGMKSVVKELKSGDFARLRIGFKPETENNIPLIDYVLSGISATVKERFDRAIVSAAEAAAGFAKGSPLQDIMQKYNGKTE